MHYPWIRSVSPARQIPGVAPEIFHWSFNRPNGNIIEAETGPRSNNFTGQWINVSENNWAVRLSTTTGASTDGPVFYRNNIVTVKFRFRPYSYEAGASTRYVFATGVNPTTGTSFSCSSNYNQLIFNNSNSGGANTIIANAATFVPLGQWHDVVVSFRTFNNGTFAGSIGATSNPPNVYINGVSAFTFAGVSVSGGGANYDEWFPHRVFTIGTTTGSGGFDCDLDYIKIFNHYQTYPLGNP